jgi:tRNA threonylcarbamoyl adenosine modification protein (Sua5/YciO/YrdC/YwlC family)
MSAPTITIVADEEDRPHVERAAQVLREGGLVVLPTETVYGGASALRQPQAVMRLRQLPPAVSTPLVIHLARPEDAMLYLGEVGELGRRMMRKLWPGPVSLIFDVPPERRRQVANDLAVSESELFSDGTLTLRCPDHPTTARVLAATGGPVVLRKADAGPADGAQSVGALSQAWREGVDLILDGGPTRHARPSTIIRVNGESYRIVRAGVYDQRIIDRMLRTTILFVCSGNTCRSPMAQAIARRVLARRAGVSEAELETRGLNVMSAGTAAVSGAKAAEPAIQAMQAMGLDLSRHRSQPLTVELIHQADVIFTMGRSHARAVLAMSPGAADKVVPLDSQADIEDPIGGDVDVYRALAAQLETLIEKRLAERALT